MPATLRNVWDVQDQKVHIAVNVEHDTNNMLKSYCFACTPHDVRAVQKGRAPTTNQPVTCEACLHAPTE